MFLPHFCVSSCPVGTFLIDYTGTWDGNQHRYICGFIAGIRWEEDDWKFDFVPVCLILSRNVSRCLTIFSQLCRLSHYFSCIFRVFYEYMSISHSQRAVLKFPPRPSPRPIDTFGGEPSVCSPRPFRYASPSVIVSRRPLLIPSPEPYVRIMWIAPSRIYRLEYRLSW